MFDKRSVINNIEKIVIAILIALFIRTFIVQAFNIPSGSMEPTLLPGDYILVNKFIYGIRIPYMNIKIFSYNEPKRGDVIVFIYPKDRSKDFIKRVIGMQGETVQIIGGKIYIDNTLISDPWGYFDEQVTPDFIAAVENFGPVLVPEGSLFVMGDNRNRSEDSRFWGFLPLNNVLGKSFIIYFSWDREAENLSGKVRWSRIGKLIH
ncbi:MAG: signal peptidase I [Syntrophobacteraceae bacterium]